MMAHKIRLNPSPEQEAALCKAAHNARFVYNWGLARWKELYEAGEKPNGFGLQKQLNAIKRDQFPWLLEASKSVAQYALKDLQAAFKNFFRSVKSDGKARYPRFKSRHKARLSFSLANDRFKVDGHYIKLPKGVGWVNMTVPLRFKGKIMSARFSFYAGHWWVSIAVQVDHKPPVHKGPSVGLDLGVKDLIVTSDGEVIENQANLRKHLKKLRKMNKALARKKKGSNRWLRAKAKLAKQHYRITCLRRDYLHKKTTYLAQTYRLIGLEDLNVSGLVKNRRLALSISDASLGEIRRQLEYKAPWFGSFVQKVGRFFPSSKLHHGCGWKNEDLKLSDRVWLCHRCGVKVHRDLNAALNIRDEAIRLASL